MKLIEDRYQSIERMTPLIRYITSRKVEKVANHLLQWWTENSFTDEEIKYSQEEIEQLRTATYLIRCLLATCKDEFKNQVGSQMYRWATDDSYFVAEVKASGENIRIYQEISETFGLLLRKK